MKVLNLSLAVLAFIGVDARHHHKSLIQRRLDTVLLRFIDDEGEPTEDQTVYTGFDSPTYDEFNIDDFSNNDINNLVDRQSAGYVDTNLF